MNDEVDAEALDSFTESTSSQEGKDLEAESSSAKTSATAPLTDTDQHEHGVIPSERKKYCEQSWEKDVSEMLEKVFVNNDLECMEKHDPNTKKIMTRQPSDPTSEKSWRNLVHYGTSFRNKQKQESSLEGRQKYMCHAVGLSLILSVINVIFSTTAIALSVRTFNPDTSNQTILVQTDTSQNAQAPCRNQRHVEFIKDDQGNRIQSGSPVSDEWLDGYGFVVQSDASSTPIAWHTSEYDVPGLYLPTVDSNVIALSDKITLSSSSGMPKDTAGTIIFDFVQQDVTLLEIGLLNVNRDIQITTIDRSGQKVSETFGKLGAGSVATVEMQQRSNIVSLNVETQGPTAVTYISYCWN